MFPTTSLFIFFYSTNAVSQKEEETFLNIVTLYLSVLSGSSQGVVVRGANGKNGLKALFFVSSDEIFFLPRVFLSQTHKGKEALESVAPCPQFLRGFPVSWQDIPSN